MNGSVGIHAAAVDIDHTVGSNKPVNITHRGVHHADFIFYLYGGIVEYNIV